MGVPSRPALARGPYSIPGLGLVGRVSFTTQVQTLINEPQQMTGQHAGVAGPGRAMMPLADLAIVSRRDVSLMERQKTSWRNWARTYSCTPARVFRPRSLEDLVAIVRQAKQAGKRVRVAGRGHAMSPLSVTEDYLVLAAGLDRIGPVDTVRRVVTVESGVTIGALDRVLRRYGLAVPTNVILTCVQYGGVVATGCHGSGWESQTISDLVEAMTIVTCTGEVVTFREE